MSIRLLTLSLAMVAVSPIARAESFLEIINGTSARTTTGTNQVVGSGVNFVVGKLRLSLDAGQRAFISYAFEGAESPLRNQFFGPGASSMIDTLASAGTMITTRIDAGLLDFSFQSQGGITGSSNKNNYAWNDANIGVVLDSNHLSGTLLFEDARSRLGSDYDYDDMVVRFSVSIVPVPEAGSGVMLMSGLGLLAVLLRRRRTP